MMNRYRMISICSLVLLASVLFGCSRSQPTRFYLLSSLDSSAAAMTQTPDLSVAIGPITLPQYLDRPQIVTQSGTNMIVLAEFDRWAEPLEGNLARVLAENLSLLLGTERLFLYPSRQARSADIQVPLKVVALDGGWDSPARLKVRWSMLDTKSRPLQPERKSDLKAQSTPNSYEELADQYTRLVARLSEEIAEAIRQQSTKK
jgi:uncharacterized lipoprotein YmbA